jgi:hypothetical protein
MGCRAKDRILQEWGMDSRRVLAKMSFAAVQLCQAQA